MRCDLSSYEWSVAQAWSNLGVLFNKEKQKKEALFAFKEACRLSRPHTSSPSHLHSFVIQSQPLSSPNSRLGYPRLLACSPLLFIPLRSPPANLGFPRLPSPPVPSRPVPSLPLVPSRPLPFHPPTVPYRPLSSPPPLHLPCPPPPLHSCIFPSFHRRMISSELSSKAACSNFCLSPTTISTSTTTNISTTTTTMIV